MAFYGEEGGAPVSPMAGPGQLANMVRKRRRAGMGGGFKRKFGMMLPPGGGMRHPIPGMPPVDPGFEIQPDPNMQDMPGGMENIIRQKMMGGQGQPLAQDRVRWGGKVWQDPNKLWGWIAARGGGIAGNKKRFYEMHPDAARRLGVPIDGEDPQAELFDPNNLRRGLVGQLTQAEGALEGSPVQGIHRVANNRMRAVGAAQGRAAALAQVMQRRLRGRRRY